MIPAAFASKRHRHCPAWSAELPQVLSIPQFTHDAAAIGILWQVVSHQLDSIFIDFFYIGLHAFFHTTRQHGNREKTFLSTFDAECTTATEGVQENFPLQ